jgi:hypothetical protein
MGPLGSGLYRIRGADGRLLYVGEGFVCGRLITHAAKVTRAAWPQDIVFANAQPLECSWLVCDDWAPHQRGELEADLIAAVTLATGAPPAAQFIG